MSIHGAIPSTSSPRAGDGPGTVAIASASARRRASARILPALSLRNLSRSYRAGIAGCSAHIEAVRAATFDVEAGEILGIVGPAGAGKSTLLLCMAGLLQPDAGTVAWFGRRADDAGRPPGVTYVPERAAHYGFMTVREAIEHHVLLRSGAVSACDHDSIAAAISGAGLDAFAETRIADLPWRVGSQLSIAQAIAGRPRVLLLDETLSQLTVPARREIIATLHGFSLRGTAIVIAATTGAGLEGFVSRIALMTDGNVSAPAEPSRLFSPSALELTILAPANAGPTSGARVAEASWERQVLRIPLDDTTPEAILSRCRSCGIRVEGSRVVRGEPRTHFPPDID